MLYTLLCVSFYLQIMNTEIKFENKEQELSFRKELSVKLISGEFEIVPSNNLESKQFNFLAGSVYRNNKSAEYYKLNTSDYLNAKGTWTKVREIISQEPLIVRSNYKFVAQLGGNSRLVGKVVIKLTVVQKDGELKVNITHLNQDENPYIKTSVDFGLMYAMDTIQPYNKLKGEYKIEVEAIGFHSIDSSAATIAYASNMALRRAFDKEMHNALLFESGRFIMYKKSPKIEAYQ